ncbi:MAG TPA: peptidase E [Candidatus Limnocylindrales bacterium]|nr:peptidase E [Candidatus Limnocylindrales bacterium]
MAERHIVAIGGGTFASDPDNGRLEEYLLDLTGKERPRICFVPTAGGDDRAAVGRFYDFFAPRAEPTWLPLFDRRRSSPAEVLLAQDLIYVAGGNTANMLAVWRLHRVDAALREAWERGIVLAGWSAGALCWFGGGVTDSFDPDLGPLNDGLAFLAGSFCPHYDTEARRRPVYRGLVGDATLADGYAADDGAALHFVGDELAEAVSSRPNALAYRVARRTDGPAEETPLGTRYLG